MRKVLLVHISSSGCCNKLVTMLNNGDFGFPYCATPAFSTPAFWCRVFQSRVFSRPMTHNAACAKFERYRSFHCGLGTDTGQRDGRSEASYGYMGGLHVSST